jgi:glycerophosphoryl diester phosphodiesterase
MKIIAHRGVQLGCTHAIENTVAAAHQTFLHPDVTGLEIDVRLTLDGELVVFHDHTLQRMCGVNVPVCDVTYKELPCMLNNISQRIPHLREILTILPTDKELWLDLKGHDPKLPESICSLLLEYPHLHSNLKILVFHKEWIDILRKHVPNISLQLLACYSKPICLPNLPIRVIRDKTQFKEFLDEVDECGVKSIGLEGSPFISPEIGQIVVDRGIRLCLWEGLASKGYMDPDISQSIAVNYITINI